MRLLICVLVILGGLLSECAVGQVKESYVVSKTDVIVLEGRKHSTIRGELVVREDRSRGDSRLIKLPVLIIKARATIQEAPVFWLGGGPGASNILSTDKLENVAVSEMLERHDIVCVGYRGADGSTLLKSKKVNKAFRGKDHQLLSDVSLDNMKLALTDYLSTLKQQGIDINRYSMLDVIDDMEQARIDLNYSRIHLLSGSYGTRVALLYSYRYPESLLRTVMIGANPPGHFIWQPEKTDEIIGIYDRLYAELPKKKYNGSIKEAMRFAFANLPKRWSIYKLDADKIKVGTFAAMFSRDFAVMVFDAYFKAALKGDYSGLFLVQVIVDMGGTSFIGDMFAKGASADYVTGTDYRAKFRSSSAVLGGNASLLYWGIADGWTTELIPESYRKCRLSDAETLVVSGNLDVSTPADYAIDELMPFLSKGELVNLVNMSHADIFQKALTTPGFLSAYYDSGVVNKDIMNSIHSVDFTPKTKFGKFKIFMAGLLN